MPKKHDIKRKLTALAGHYDQPEIIVAILMSLTNIATGTIATSDGSISIDEFLELHQGFCGVAIAHGHKLTVNDLKEVLVHQEVEPSGKSTRGKPDTSDNARAEEDRHEARYGVWSEVRERMQEDGRGG